MDFLGPDAWKTYVTIPHDQVQMGKMQGSILSSLLHSINIAVLFTNECCLLPPAFILQSDLVFNAIKKKSTFLDANLILLPLRENSIDSYIGKKMSEYQYVKDTHSGFYQKRHWDFLYKHRNAIIRRNSAMGKTIAEKWESASDSSLIWKPMYNLFYSRADAIRLAPSRLKKQGTSVTLEAIIKNVGLAETDVSRFFINQAIQYEYISQYLYEYNAAIIANIPPKPLLVDYLISIESVYYDYNFLRKILKKMGAYNFLVAAHEDTIIELRENSFFIEFKNILHEKSMSICDRNNLFLFFSRIFDKYKLGSALNVSSNIFIHQSEHRNLIILCDRLNCFLDNYFTDSRNKYVSSPATDMSSDIPKILSSSQRSVTMSFTFNGSNIGQINNFEGSTNGTAVANISHQASNLNQFIPDLEALLSVSNAEEHLHIEEAISAAKVNEEGSFIKSLKMIADLGTNILSNVVSMTFITYLRAKGLL